MAGAVCRQLLYMSYWTCRTYGVRKTTQDKHIGHSWIRRVLLIHIWDLAANIGIKSFVAFSGLLDQSTRKHKIDGPYGT